MANVVSKSKIDQVNARLKALGVVAGDLKEEFIKGSGRGGQKINKTSSCVQLAHLKTGIRVKCQQTGSREQNRFFARRLLLEKLEARVLGKESERAKRVFKIRARKRRKTQRAKERMINAKRKRGLVKRLRRNPGPEDME